MKPRTVLHVDMDAFYASVEQRERPDLKGLPVVVGADPRGGRGRGVVAACSYEAREFGIHSALPISRAWQLCPSAVYLPPRGSLYAEVSRRIMRILRAYTDLVEPVSIDEAFLDVTGSSRLFGDGARVARTIKDRIQDEEQLSCSVGVAANKFVAKIASDAEKPNGLCVVARGEEKAFLASLPIRKMWGVGPKLEQRLRKWGILSIGDLGSRESSFWTERLGRHGQRLWELSQGLDDRPVQPVQGFKSLSHERTFETDCRDFQEVRKTLLALCEKVARRCRRHGVSGGTVRLKWRFEDFSTHTRQRKLDSASDDADLLFAVVLELCRDFLPLARRVRLVGVGLSSLEHRREAVGKDLFTGPRGRKRSLDESLDRIARKFGAGAIGRASLLDRGVDEEEGFGSFPGR